MRLLPTIAIAFLLGCTAPQAVEQIPPVEYEVGFSFDLPCAEHGFHTQVVTGSRLIRLYEITVEGEVQGEATGESIQGVLEMIELTRLLQEAPVNPEAAEPASDEEESR